MKTFTLLKSLLIACLFSLMGGSAWAQNPVTLASFTNAASTDWEHTAALPNSKTKYFQLLGATKYVQSPEIDLANVSALSITMRARTYGVSKPTSQNAITIQLIPSDGSDNITLETLTPDNSSNKSYPLNIKNTFHGKGKIRFVALSSTSSIGAGVYSATITEAGTFSITSAGYATYFTDKAFTMPKGVTGSIITDANGGSLTIEDKYPAGSVVPASTALLLKGAEKEYTYDVVTTTETAPTNNMLYGSTFDTVTMVDGDLAAYLFYKLSYNDAGDKLGFYWVSENGDSFESDANKAWLAVPTSSGNSQLKGFALDGTTTGIQQATLTNTVSPIFDINGRRVNTLNGAAKGVYIVGGKKVMVK